MLSLKVISLLLLVGSCKINCQNTRNSIPVQENQQELQQNEPQQPPQQAQPQVAASQLPRQQVLVQQFPQQFSPEILQRLAHAQQQSAPQLFTPQQSPPQVSTPQQSPPQLLTPQEILQQSPQLSPREQEQPQQLPQQTPEVSQRLAPAPQIPASFNPYITNPYSATAFPVEQGAVNPYLLPGQTTVNPYASNLPPLLPAGYPYNLNPDLSLSNGAPTVYSNGLNPGYLTTINYGPALQPAQYPESRSLNPEVPVQNTQNPQIPTQPQNGQGELLN